MYGICPMCGSENLLMYPNGAYLHKYKCRDCGNIFLKRDLPQKIEQAFPNRRFRITGPKIEDYQEDLTYAELDSKMRERWKDEPEVGYALDYYANHLYVGSRYKLKSVPAEIVRTKSRRSRR